MPSAPEKNSCAGQIFGGGWVMSTRQTLYFNAYGPNVPSDFRNSLFPVAMGKHSGLTPGCGLKWFGNAMDAGTAGIVCHFRMDGPVEDNISILGRVADPAGSVGYQIQFAGLGEYRLEGVKEPLVYDPSKNVICSYINHVSISNIPPGDKHEMLTFSIPPEFLMKLSADGRGINGLRKIAKNGRAVNPSLAGLPANPAIARIGRESAYHPYSGAMERLFLQTKTMELLSEMARMDPESRKAPVKKAQAGLGRIMNTQAVLALAPGDPPGVLELSAMVGAGYRALNLGFLHYFSQTIFQYALGVALDEARKKIEDEGLLIEAAPSRYGFADLGKFLFAYQRRFGRVPPGVEAG